MLLISSHAIRRIGDTDLDNKRTTLSKGATLCKKVDLQCLVILPKLGYSFSSSMYSICKESKLCIYQPCHS